VLVTEFRIHEEQLRADLQQYYGIDLDYAMAGGHTAYHIACLMVQLPVDARIRTAENPDNQWTLTDILLASILNSLNGLIYGMSDSKKRGQKPQLVGPSWMQSKRMRSIPARAMPVDELISILNQPRK